MDIVQCNGTQCGEGIHVGSGSYICPHNNLGVKYPHLIKEWDPLNKLSVYDYTHGSVIKAKWICATNICGCHSWEATILNRTKTKNPTGCPYCASDKPCVHNNLGIEYPELTPEWDKSNKLTIYDYLPKSNAKVNWICLLNPCGCHIWNAKISGRTNNTSGCPYCSGKKACIHDNLEINFPNLICQWHPNNKPMNTYKSYSKQKVLWICQNNIICNCHIWEAAISHRTRNDTSGCPFCTNHKVCEHNNLELNRPELKIEWHPDNKAMNLYSVGSGIKVLWKCHKNLNHIWVTSIFSRTCIKSADCPHCSKSRGYSKAQIKWIDEIMLNENLYIQHALDTKGEYKINGVGKVDGYCKENNTVYEYHGDYWHGNPLIYDKDEINPSNKKTYGLLYEKTIIRENMIKMLGYNLIVKWETDII